MPPDINKFNDIYYRKHWAAQLCERLANHRMDQKALKEMVKAELAKNGLDKNVKRDRDLIAEILDTLTRDENCPAKTVFTKRRNP